MAHLSNDEFLTRLEHLFAARKDKGSVFLVQKRMTYEPEASTSAAAAGDDVDMGEPRRDADDDDREWPLLLRATDGKSNKDSKVKLSTVVQPAAVSAFLDRYSLLLRTEFASSLRPKRKRADLVRARLVRQLTRQAKLRARRKGAADDDDELEPWMASAETIEAEAQRRAKALEARARAAAAAAGPAAGVGPGAGSGAKGKGASAGGAAAAPAGAFRVVLPKVVGPRRGNGVERRRRAEKRRNKVVDKVKRRREAKLGGQGAAP
ncbi:hypothetical protein JCM8208_004126 [Rhodotorula glutinis]